MRQIFTFLVLTKSLFFMCLGYSLSASIPSLSEVRRKALVGKINGQEIVIAMPFEFMLTSHKNSKEALSYISYIENYNRRFKSHRKIVRILPYGSLPLLDIKHRSINEQINLVESYVSRELKLADALIIPGDDYNMPAFTTDKKPMEAIFDYHGKAILDLRPSIYLKSRRDFYLEYPKHRLNPNSLSLKVEAVSIRYAIAKGLPIFTSCHGTQLYAILQGAKLEAGLKDHGSLQQHPVNIQSGSQTARLIGAVDDQSPHFHSISISTRGLPKTIYAVGWYQNIIEIIEDRKKEDYFGYQSHPELVQEHKGFDAWIDRVVSKHLD